MKKSDRGFTLVEMLVVIAIIAVMISVVIPALSSELNRARATTDAANLRSLLGQVNTILVSNDKLDSATAAQLQIADSITYPDAKKYILYCDTHFVETYYVDGENYYSVDYFADVADDGESDMSTSKPIAPAGLVYEWFEAGKGAITD